MSWRHTEDSLNANKFFSEVKERTKYATQMWWHTLVIPAPREVNNVRTRLTQVKSNRFRGFYISVRKFQTQKGSLSLSQGKCHRHTGTSKGAYLQHRENVPQGKHRDGHKSLRKWLVVTKMRKLSWSWGRPRGAGNSTICCSRSSGLK